MISRAALLFGALAASAASQHAAAADISGEIGLVSDYRFRGLSLSDHKPALQASVTLDHDSGLYFEVWGSTIDGKGSNAATELDLTAGDEIELAGWLMLDLSATYYLYPGDKSSNYAEGTAVLTATKGRASASLGYSFVPPQRGTRDEQGEGHQSRYAYAELAYELADVPVNLTARAGYERGFFDEVAGGGKWDWSAGAEFSAGEARLGLAYVGCGPGRIASHAVVASLFLDF